MLTMTDDNGTTWSAGDRVWDRENKRQGIISEILSGRIVSVDFPGSQGEAIYVSGLVNLSNGQKEATPAVSIG